jgi:hypothetical protein
VCNAFSLRLSLLVLALPALVVTSPLYAEAQADPMRPPSATSSGSVSSRKAVQYYHLSSILISPGHRSAIINGKRVSVGERIGRARVTEIRGNEVTLSIAGKTRKLTLIPLSIKKPVEASRQ